MLNRKEVTKNLIEKLEIYINPKNDPRIYTAKEVTFDYLTEHPIRVDCMRFKPINNSIGGIEKGLVYCFEIKSCKEDFTSGHGLNFIGDYNYLVLDFELFNEIKNQIPYDVGVYAVFDNDQLKIVKKAKLRQRQKSVSEILLMMFRSSNRELLKQKRVIQNEGE